MVGSATSLSTDSADSADGGEVTLGCGTVAAVVAALLVDDSAVVVVAGRCAVGVCGLTNADEVVCALPLAFAVGVAVGSERGAVDGADGVTGEEESTGAVAVLLLAGVVLCVVAGVMAHMKVGGI